MTVEKNQSLLRPAAKRKPSASGPLLWFAAALLSVGIGLFNPLFGFAPLAIVAALWVLRIFGAGAVVPRNAYGWLYASVIFVTCWAPSLGTLGTILRFSAALVVVAFLIQAMQSAHHNLPPLAAIGIFTLVVILVFGAIMAPSVGYGVARLINWVMFIPLLFLVYVKPDVKGVLFGIVATSVWQMIGVGLQLLGLLGGVWGGILTSGSSYDDANASWLIRYTGFVWNPNNLALVLAVAIIGLTALIFHTITLRQRILSTALVAVFIVGIILTGSRGGLVAVALGLVVVFVALGQRGFAIGTAVVVAAGTFASLSKWEGLATLLGSLSAIIKGTDTSTSSRAATWAERLQESGAGGSVIGTGFGGYQPDLFARQSGLDIDTNSAIQATIDNSWIKLILESGVIGVVALALLFLVAIVGALLLSKGETKLWGIAVSAALIAIAWRSFSVDMLDQNPWNAIIFLGLGLAFASWKKPSVDLAPQPTQATTSYLRSRQRPVS